MGLLTVIYRYLPYWATEDKEQEIESEISFIMYFYDTCTTVACLPPIRGLEKCRVIGHNPHFSSLCSLSCLNPKVLLKGI